MDRGKGEQLFFLSSYICVCPIPALREEQLWVDRCRTRLAAFGRKVARRETAAFGRGSVKTLLSATCIQNRTGNPAATRKKGTDLFFNK